MIVKTGSIEPMNSSYPSCCIKPESQYRIELLFDRIIQYYQQGKPTFFFVHLNINNHKMKTYGKINCMLRN